MTFEEFATARLPELLRYAAALTGDRDLAQDVVQEVLARAQLRWRSVCAAESPERYVRRMVVNEYLSWRRRWSVRNISFVGDRLADVGDRAPGGRDFARDHALRDDLWQRLTRLPRKQRAVLVLRYYEGCDDEEIAEVLQCATATVRSHAARALRSLRAAPEPLPRLTVGEIR
ncbi:SigE family RNA polymerase sigma factor [Kineococcus xinjiangensis]|uniref:SigE family RNA polymerase sigma factor n=1 Tax=Kineococcus xinjiangensis TaxID=512762 RepID=UPI001B80D556|nr:SigE family RNA polymerase sigma factor [Kineococcus xinjiangensis]